jgi:3-oxoacyl-[acyl-carrier protein] reductase
LSLEAAGPVAFITGAAGGIGAACAAALAEQGFALALADLSAPARGLRAQPALSLAFDVTDEAATRDALAEVATQLGRLDLVVHAAGQAGKGPLVDVTADEWRRLIDVNLNSAFLIARAAHDLLAQSRGSLVLFSSSNALNGGSALSGPAYAVAKAGIINLTRYLAKEWAAQGIRVNCLAPGPVVTPMLDRLSPGQLAALEAAVPLGRFGQPEEVAATVRYLASAEAAWLTGTVHNISGGLVLD